jgi:hypothetical protein
MRPALILILRRDPDRTWRYEAHLDSERVVTSDQPVVDGARELLARGFDPADMLTARHAGSDVDSFRSMPISQWARWTYKEPTSGRLQRTNWTPHPRVKGVENVSGDAKERDRADLAALPHVGAIALYGAMRSHG